MKLLQPTGYIKARLISVPVLHRIPLPHMLLPTDREAVCASVGIADPLISPECMLVLSYVNKDNLLQEKIKYKLYIEMFKVEVQQDLFYFLCPGRSRC